uniref:hypothetical protein n=1 Tax=Lachnoclostridium phocaeense TaxID=1871021 RepID=UPI0026DD18D6|nr:hypothetical protein [Lachnoclostridium phocaeense]
MYKNMEERKIGGLRILYGASRCGKTRTALKEIQGLLAKKKHKVYVLDGKREYGTSWDLLEVYESKYFKVLLQELEKPQGHPHAYLELEKLYNPIYRDTFLGDEERVFMWKKLKRIAQRGVHVTILISQLELLPIDESSERRLSFAP